MDEPVSPPSGQPRDPYAPPPESSVPERRPAPPQPRAQRGSSEPAHRREGGSGQPAGGRPVDPHGWRALFATVCGVMAGALLWPWGLLGVALCLLGAWSGLRLRALGRRQGVRFPAATAAIIIGLGGTLLTGSLTTFGYVFHDELRAYQECQSGANTTTAQQLCEQRLRDQIADHTGFQLPALP